MKGSEKDRRRKSTPATAPQSSGAPSKPSSSSSQPSRVPPQASKEPSQPDKAPAQPEKALAQPENAPAQSSKAPARQLSAPVEQSKAPAQPSNGPPQPEKAPAQPVRNSTPLAKTRSLPSKASRAQPQPSRGPPQPSRAQRQPAKAPLRKLLRVASVACGIQFGWALQLSLLTPYVQELGIPHAFASVIWLCGPISGFFVQPLVGHLSDRCTSPYGRRRPFIIAGAAFIVVAVLIVGHSADIGWMFGDTEKSRVGAIVAFVIGFWLLDVANNVTQGPCRALLGDLTGNDQRRTRVANAYFSLFMAVGNILGFATGSYAGWYRVFPFTITTACGVDCANLKSAFFLDIIVIAITTYISTLAADEIPLSNTSDPENEQLLEHSGHAEEAFFWEIFGTFKYLPGPVWIILLVTALNWVGWFPFLLYDTDWMGREIYGGEPNDGKNYNKGVRMGATGLMLNSVFLGVTSLLMEVLCRRLGAGVVWGMSNILMTICFIAMIVISYISNNTIKVPGALPSDGVVAAALVVFAILGIPLAITYSVPYALVSSRIESLGLGQGLSMGVLNLAIVIPQIIVSIGSGPWDQLFGGGNSPAIAVAAIASFVSGLIAILAIPRSRALEKSRSRR